MKLAKIEMKMVLTMLLLGYDYQIVDKDGNHPTSAPRVDRNDCHQVRPDENTPKNLYFAFLTTLSHGLLLRIRYTLSSNVLSSENTMILEL